MAIVDGLCTLAEARASLGWIASDTANNSDLEAYITAVTPVIEDHTGPLIARSRTFTLSGGSGVLVLPVRFTAITAITENGSAVTDYVADSQAGLIYAGSTTATRSWAAGVRNIIVVATVGSGTIPANVNLAARELVRHLWQMGRQGSRPAYNNEAPNIVPQGFAMPKRVLELLAPNQRLGGFA